MRNRYLFLLIIAVAVLLRLFGSGIYEHPEFFSDEIGRVSTAHNMFFTGQPVLWTDMNGNPALHFSHPAFDKLAYLGFFALAGDGYVLRLFPVAAGIITIILTFYLGKELFSKRIGLLAGLLMAVSRYHIYASQLIDIDGSFLPLFSIASILFFVIYKKKSDKYKSVFIARKYLLISMLFFGLCIFTKLLGALVIVPIMIYSIYYDKNRRTFLTINRRLIKKKHVIEFGYFALAGIMALLVLLSIAIAYNDMGWFSGPFNVLLNSAKGTVGANLSTIVHNKMFSLASIGWQLTPFLGALLILALLFVKKDERYMLLGSWIVFILLVFLIPVHGDVQRYFTSSLPAVFLLISVFAFNVYKELDEKQIINIGLLSAVFFVVSAFLGINDLMGYYELAVIGLLFAVAFFIMLIPKRYATNILIAGFAGMSLFAVVGTNAWIGIGTYTVHELVQGIEEQGWPYDEVWAWEDIIYQITPKDKIMHQQRPELNMEFVRENNVKYIAVHTLRDENLFREFSKNCRFSEFVNVNNHVTGLLCEIR